MSMDGVGVRVAVGVRDVVCDGVPVPVPGPDDDAPRDSVAVDDAVAEAVTVGDADGGTQEVSTTAPAAPTPALVLPTTEKPAQATGKLAFTQLLPPPPPLGKLVLP